MAIIFNVWSLDNIAKILVCDVQMLSENGDKNDFNKNTAHQVLTADKILWPFDTVNSSQKLHH